MNRALLLLAAVSAAASVSIPRALHAQDVELLGRIHGTRPPQGYFDQLERDPGAFQFSRAWRNRTGLGVDPAQAGGASFDLQGAGGPAATSGRGLGPREKPVDGTFTVPLVLGLFQDSPPPDHTAAEIQAEFFDGPTADPQRATITEYYHEVSRGLVQLHGFTFTWLTSPLTRTEVTGASSGLDRTDSEVGEFIWDLVDQLDRQGTDWTVFDNDGPDGVPNSGDDDGYVDILAVMHPTEGGECPNPGRSSRIWSHRWQLSKSIDDLGGEHPGTGQPYTTSSLSASGDRIKVDDYVVVPVLECDWDDEDDFDLEQIGVFAHELGHGFGLPDLYGVGSNYYGAGNWGLMGTGSWGCRGQGAGLLGPARPCHPGAWTKFAMGWVDVIEVPAGTGLQERTLGPVETEGTILKIDANDGSGEFFLLEHRTRTGFDQELYEEGILIWHVDPGVLATWWPFNAVNADPNHPGVWLRQADGLNELMTKGGGRGDPGDIFTPAEGANAFHASTNPSSHTHPGAPSGLTVRSIRQGTGGLTFDLDNRYYTVTLEVQGDADDGQGFVVDGAAPAAPPVEFTTASYEKHSIEAPSGADLGVRSRVAFAGWDDAPTLPRTREYLAGHTDATLRATYGGAEHLLDVAFTSPADPVEPGTLKLEPAGDGRWVLEGTTVLVEAAPRTGFEFAEWRGDFAGNSNPFSLEVAGPAVAEARFEVTYSVAGNAMSVDLVAGREQALTLQAANGNDPVLWTVVDGRLAEGLSLSPSGLLSGVPLEDGTFPVMVRARDAIGLEAELELELVVDPPPLGLQALAIPLFQEPGGPTAHERSYLDWSGNRNGAYDVGDFRAFLQAHPETPHESLPSAPDAVGRFLDGVPDPVMLPPVILRHEEGS